MGRIYFFNKIRFGQRVALYKISPEVADKWLAEFFYFGKIFDLGAVGFGLRG